jgi:hypothetical protein
VAEQVGKSSEETVHATVVLEQMGTTVTISVECDTEAAADAFFEQIASDHLDKGVITIRSVREISVK